VDADDARFERVVAAFPGRIRALRSASIRGGEARILVWTHEHPHATGLLETPDDRWVAAVGNPTSRESSGSRTPDAFGVLAEHVLGGAPATPRFSPPFATVCRSGPSTYDVEVDRAGLQHLYFRPEGSDGAWIASSSLALAAAGRALVDLDGVAEWLAVGHFLSDRTLLRGVRKLGCGERLRLGPDGVSRRGPWAPDPAGTATELEYAQAVLEAVGACSAPPGTETELTGGLDTRLVLAAQASLGLPLDTWTVSAPGSGELRTIERLQARIPFAHRLVPVRPEFADALPELVEELHGLSDGEVSALEYVPLLLAFDANGRAGMSASVTGSGGEIARGFYYSALHRGGREVRDDALRRMVTAYAARIHRDLRREVVPEPDHPVDEVIERFLASSPGRTADRVLDDFYLRTRMQRFGGRNITTTGLFYRQAAPFFDNRLVDVALGLPLEAKEGGRATRRTIAALLPAASAVALDSGIPVPPPTWRRPWTRAARPISLVRKGLTRYGGRVGSAVARSAPAAVPWDAVQAHAGFRDFARDVLLSPSARIRDLVEPCAIESRCHAGLDHGALYPLGLLLTLELTLSSFAKVDGAKASP
jgi:hypothetical protein